MQGSGVAVSRPLVAVDVAVKVITVGLLLWAVLNPDLPQFSGKAFTGRALAYPIALAILPIGWWLFGRSRIAYPVVVDILLGLPFLIDVVGNALNLYDSIEWWDDANHFFNWRARSVPCDREEPRVHFHRISAPAMQRVGRELDHRRERDTRHQISPRAISGPDSGDLRAV